MRAKIIGVIGALLTVSLGCRPAGSDAGPAVPGGLLPPQGTTRVIDFTTDEGTWMSVDVTPEGQWIVFDLLAQIYRVPIQGGEATVLTESGGNALNFDPAVSPDGKSIAFISDRGGQNNVWVMAADGTAPRSVFADEATRFTDPAWAPDGQSLVAVRTFRTPGRGWHRQTSELWRLPLDGTAPTRLLGGQLTHYEAPAFDSTGRYLYFHVSYSTGEGLGLLAAGHRIQRLELASGRIENVRSNEPAELSPQAIEALRNTGYAADVGIDPPAALVPALSPDGSRLAFALEEPDETMEYRGHTFRPRTVLVVRDLRDGAERRLLAPITKDLTQVNAQYGYRAVPAYAWTPDGSAIILSEGGKLRKVDVATGTVVTIPFTARVHRVMSEQPRSRVTIADTGFRARAIQWPAGSPDGKQLAFVAVGRLWVMDLPSGVPRALAGDSTTGVVLTPRWSPGGDRLIYATWDDRSRGQVWTVAPAGGAPVRVTRDAGEYYSPVLTAEGPIVVRGPGSRAPDWNGWDARGGWQIVRIGPDGAAGAPLGSVREPRQLFNLGADVSVADQLENAAGLGSLYKPFPSEETLRQVVRVSRIPLAGGSAQPVATLPARRAGVFGHPALSPDGRWLAFETAGSVWVQDLRALASPDSAITTDPNVAVPGRTRVGDLGGSYPGWRDATTLELSSGSRYVTYDVERGTVTVVPIALDVPRPLPSGAIALVGARIITIDGDRVIPSGTVVVRGARIACVGDCDTTGVSRVVDVRGKTIIPGLVDVHAHHTTEASGVIPFHRPASASALAYGVTTIVDPSASPRSVFPLAELVDAGRMIGPRTYTTADILISSGVAWGDQVEIANAEQAAFEIHRRADQGAVSIKNFRQTSRRQHQLLLQAARARGITQTGEGGPLYFDVGLALDGQTGWEHLIAPFPVYRDVVTFFGQAGIQNPPTVIVAGHVNGAKTYYRPRAGLDRDAKFLRVFPRAALARMTAGERVLPKSEFSFPFMAETAAEMMRAGAYSGLGEHGEQPGIGTHWEAWALAEAMTPLEVLTVGTMHGARFVGLESEIGSIVPGKLADLIVLNGDPLADIRRTADIAYVMKGGWLYDGATLATLWPVRASYLPPWN